MDSVTLATPPSKTVLFPSAAVEAKLRNELAEAVKVEASIRGISLPSTAAQISKAAIHVDSLVVVSILCAVEPIVGFELPESVVRTGGYASAETALASLMPRIEQEWRKKNGAKP